MTTVSAPRGALTSPGETYCARRLKREGRPLTPHTPAVEVPITTDLRVFSEMVQALIDTARAPVALSWRMEHARHIVGALEDGTARPFAELLALLGEDYEKAIALGSEARDSAWRALYAHTAQGASWACDALRGRPRSSLVQTCIICGGYAAGTFCVTHDYRTAVA